MYHWVGNSAKARVIALILSDPRPKLTVFDYGAGRGGDWPDVLAAHAQVELVCFEPDAEATHVMRSRLPTDRARVLSPEEFEAAPVAADYIVSFSVLEHVVDKPAYMRHAKRHLGPDGTFFLNYDDGHFRTALDLDEFQGWRQNLAVTLQNRLAWAWPRVKREDRYQARVTSADLAKFVHDAGFAIIDDHYENLLSFKALAKTMPIDRQQDFIRFWIDTEAQLNQRFRTGAEPRMGDATNLWHEMASRTFALRHG